MVVTAIGGMPDPTGAGLDTCTSRLETLVTTIAQVAQRAGVSTATVSRVLNGKPVRADLAQAVQRAAADLAYLPDRTARSLRRRYSDVVALILPDIENPFFTSVARGVEDVAQQAGLSVVLCNTDDEPAKEERYLSIAAGENMAGVILAPASATPRLAPLTDKQRVVVVLDRPVSAEVDQVFFDNISLGREATRRLLQRSFTRIACVTGPRRTSTAVDRAAGWRAAMEEAGWAADDALLRHVNFKVDGGRTAMRHLLDLADPPDAVLATNNLVGVGVLQKLVRTYGSTDHLGVGIIGDLPFATSPVEGLTLVPLRPRELGVQAAQLFLERLRGDVEPARRVVVADR